MLKTEATRSRKQPRTLKQLHEDLKELGFEGAYDRGAAFARVWREGQNERINPSSKRTAQAHKGRNVVERAINRLKNFRAVAAGYDKRGNHFLSAVSVATIIL